MTRRITRLIAARRRKPRFKKPGAGLTATFAVLAILLIFSGRGVRFSAGKPPAEIKPPLAPAQVIPSAQETVSPSPARSAATACPSGCDVPPPGCVIKGNISFRTGEWIYHLPGQQYYEKTVIRPEQGERWFCTESEAQANRWRKSKR